MRTATWATVWSVVRLLAALLLIAAVIAQFVSTFTYAADAGRDVATTVANFFSFFTILSNLIGAAALLAAAIWWFVRGGAREPFGVALALAAATTYLAITGVVYNLLLRGLDPSADQVGWSNEVLHVVAPLVLLVDLFVAPTRRALPWRSVLGILAFPIAWIGYTLLRAPLVVGPVDGAPFWYPYPFLDPNGPDGWGGVAAYIVGIAVAFVAVGSFVVWIGRRRARRLPG